jgi:hypothetical protein
MTAAVTGGDYTSLSTVAFDGSNIWIDRYRQLRHQTRPALSCGPHSPAKVNDVRRGHAKLAD